jgi:alpha-N-arabinofuranosidase
MTRPIARLSLAVLAVTAGILTIGAPAWAGPLNTARPLQYVSDGDFESADPTAHWRATIYHDGDAPRIELDTTIARGGRRSLRVTATTPADVALAQSVGLTPGRLWRARAVIRTADLVAPGTDVAAALHIQSASGATLARSDSCQGTTDWRTVDVLFRAPTDGNISVVLFFVGYGRGTGQVWFDDVRLEPVYTEEPIAVEIQLGQRGPAPIDLKQNGQFIEPLCDMIPSMIAQQVAGDSFEEEPPWNQGFRPAVDRPHRPWYPSGAVHAATYELDTNRPFNGRRSQRISVSAAGARAGLSQDGFYTTAGVNYRLSLHMRGLAGERVFASLHGGGLIAGPVELGTAGDGWGKAEAVLTANRTIDNCTLTIEFDGPGIVSIDRVYLIGDDAVGGIWRPDVVAAIRALNPGIIRYGGSTLEVAGPGVHEFEWRECVGPWDQRAPYPVACWGGLDANFAGPAEFVQLCQLLGAEPLLCVRWTGRTPADAAAQVEYFNGPADSPMGRLRAEHGHPEPYGVRYWQIGNEVAGDEYNRSLADFARAMKQVDPRIRLITSWGKPDLRNYGGGLIDYTSQHHYRCEDLAGLDRGFAELRAELRDLPGGPVRAAITEWNTTAAEWGLGRGKLWTLANALACARYHNLIQRYADVVEITNRSNLVDSFCSGVIQTGPNWLYCTPTYYAQQLYARAAGSFPVELRIAGGPPWPLHEPDVAATLTADGRTLRIYAVNSTPDTRDVTLRLPDSATPVRGGTAFVLRDRDEASTAEVINTRDDPRRVALTEQPFTLGGRELPARFAPFSVTLLELELGE